MQTSGSEASCLQPFPMSSLVVVTMHEALVLRAGLTMQ